ncbi:MAG: helix-turn-helix domain-containing protein [Candidatus Cryptobacteroides sp.]
MNNLDLTELYGRSNNDIIVELGRRFRSYRIALRMTQKDVSEKTGVSVMTIVRFEKGNGCSIRIDNLVALMRSIQRLENIAEIIPDVPASLYDIQTVDNRVKRRVKRRRDEK